MISAIAYGQNAGTNEDSIPRIKKETSHTTSNSSEAKPVVSKINSANIYPNPAGSIAFIDYNIASNTKDAKIVIYNILGAVSKEVELTKDEGRIEINTSNLNPGVYFYSLQIDGVKESTKRLVIKY